MLVSGVLSLVLPYWPLVCLAIIIAGLLRNKFHNGLHKYPGPALAAYTNLWRFVDNLTGSSQQTAIRLHRRYGDIVRLGPNVLSFADPAALKSIYGLNKGMIKSDFYPVQQATVKGERLQSMFATQDETYHARYRRCVNGAFAMSALVSYEPLVDSTIDAFIEQTRRRYCQPSKDFDQQPVGCHFSRWLQYFAFDVIGELTWSRRLGFVERCEDVDGIIAFLADFLRYAAPVGQMPWLDLLWYKNPLRLRWEKYGPAKSVHPVTAFALKQSASRMAEMNKIRTDGIVDQSNGRPVDLLMKFTQAQHDHPEFMTDRQVLASCTSMIFAGSETMAISFSSIFYHLIQTPRVYAKLMFELDSAAASGAISPKPNNRVSWSEAQKLPYLEACILESFRIHPAPGLMLERIVPAGGIRVGETEVPAGTIVGCNAWVVHRNREVFGSDVDVFRPERWLETDEARSREMKAMLFQFGAGARTCVGKNIALLEIYKLVPAFLRCFEVRMEKPGGKWKTWCTWFVRVIEFNTVFTERVPLATTTMTESKI